MLQNKEKVKKEDYCHSLVKTDRQKMKDETKCFHIFSVRKSKKETNFSSYATQNKICIGGVVV